MLLFQEQGRGEVNTMPYYSWTRLVWSDNAFMLVWMDRFFPAQQTAVCQIVFWMQQKMLRVLYPTTSEISWWYTVCIKKANFFCLYVSWEFVQIAECRSKTALWIPSSVWNHWDLPRARFNVKEVSRFSTRIWQIKFFHDHRLWWHLRV